jgi:hypothetical protein
MRRTGYFLIVVIAILDFGCASRGDWISEMLTLVDVSGTWEGTIEPNKFGQGSRSIRLVLLQRGARVTGVAEAEGNVLGVGGRSVDGFVNGDSFTFHVAAFRGEARVDGAEMKGQGSGGYGGGGSPAPAPSFCVASGKAGTSAEAGHQPLAGFAPITATSEIVWIACECGASMTRRRTRTTLPAEPDLDPRGRRLRVAVAGGGHSRPQ